MPEPDGRSWPDELKLVHKLRARIDSDSSRMLADVSGSWEAPYLRLRFHCVDDTALEVLHGDRYTAIMGEQLDFHGGLSTDELARVLLGIVDGAACYVVRRKASVIVTEHFEVTGDPDRIGIYTGGLLFLHRYALDKLLPVSARISRVDLSFAGRVGAQ
jgi:hypothetical protein